MSRHGCRSNRGPSNVRPEGKKVPPVPPDAYLLLLRKEFHRAARLPSSSCRSSSHPVMGCLFRSLNPFLVFLRAPRRKSVDSRSYGKGHARGSRAGHAAPFLPPRGFTVGGPRSVAKWRDSTMRLVGIVVQITRVCTLREQGTAEQRRGKGITGRPIGW